MSAAFHLDVLEAYVLLVTAADIKEIQELPAVKPTELFVRIFIYPCPATAWIALLFDIRQVA